MSQQTIPSGLYFGFTKAELQQELTRYKAEVKKSASSLAGASVNGQSATFGPRRDLTIAEWQIELQTALAYFGAADDPLPAQTAVRFT